MGADVQSPKYIIPGYPSGVRRLKIKLTADFKALLPGPRWEHLWGTRANGFVDRPPFKPCKHAVSVEDRIRIEVLLAAQYDSLEWFQYWCCRMVARMCPFGQYHGEVVRCASGGRAEGGPSTCSV